MALPGRRAGALGPRPTARARPSRRPRPTSSTSPGASSPRPAPTTCCASPSSSASGATLDFYLLGVLDQDDKKAVRRRSRSCSTGTRRNEAALCRPRLGRRDRRSTSRSPPTCIARRTRQPRDLRRSLLPRRLPRARRGAAAVRLRLRRARSRQDGQGARRATTPSSCPTSPASRDAEATALDAWVEAGGVLLATGETGFYDERGVPRDEAGARQPAGHRHAVDARDDMKGAYFRIAPTASCRCPRRKLLMLDGRYYVAEPKPGAETPADAAAAAALRPARALFPRCRRATLPGVIIGKHGKGTVVYLPWHPDALYYRDSLPDIRVLLTDLLTRHIAPAPARLEGRGSLELTVQRAGRDRPRAGPRHQLRRPAQQPLRGRRRPCTACASASAASPATGTRAGRRHRARRPSPHPRRRRLPLVRAAAGRGLRGDRRFSANSRRMNNRGKSARIMACGHPTIAATSG